MANTMKSAPAGSIDEYITTFPAKVQTILEAIRATVQQAAPEAAETIKYAMPAFTLHGSNLVHFAAFKSHIGFYPVPQDNAAFEGELSTYKQGKGSVQFPLDQPMPLGLIARLVKFQAQRNLEKAKAK